MEKMLSCDWGSSTFRLRLVDFDSLNIISELSSKQGISQTYTNWSTNTGEGRNRFSFYLDIIRDHILKMESLLNSSLDHIPLIISGMASASIGMMEVPYGKLPVEIKGSALELISFPANDVFKHPILLISGLCTKDDVMRGEETILIGCAGIIDLSAKDHVLILPGTHSKHLTIKEGMLMDIKTYMTGEWFDVLSTKTMLSATVEASDWSSDNQRGFEMGVAASNLGELLHNIFLIRTNMLFNKMNAFENYYFLSGLLIGTELQSFRNDHRADLTIVSEESLGHLYLLACQLLGIGLNGNGPRMVNADQALIRGQAAIYQQSQ